MVHPDVTTDRKVRAPQPRKGSPLTCGVCGFPAVVVLSGPDGAKIVCRHCQKPRP